MTYQTVSTKGLSREEWLNPFMLADVDRLVVGEDAGLGCKTASAFNAGKWKDGQIPPHYLIQKKLWMSYSIPINGRQM